jgi:Secretion system C-terminal sorting domain
MIKNVLFLLMLICCTANNSSAQTNGLCDPILVNQVQADMIAQGFPCLIGAGPFACVNDVNDYAFEHCPPTFDTTGNTCDPVVVAQLQADLIAQGFTCLIGAGPFTCESEVINYVYANCPPSIDTTGNNPCDPIVVAQVQADLIALGYDCLIGAGPFTCVDEVYNYAFTNCAPPIDTTGGNQCDPIFVAQVQADLIAQGFDCLVDAGPFTCVDEVFDFAFTNCAPPIDTTGGNQCDSAMVAQTIADLIAEGYDCLIGAGPFACVHEVVCYAFDNCPLAYDSTNYVLPDCIIYAPDSMATFQQMILYIVANCDSTVSSGIPACWLTAPIFATDDEFIQWLVENCDLDGLVGGNSGAMTQAYFGSQVTSAVRTPTVSYNMSISPNPATNVINVRLKGAQINWVELVDINGRRVLSIQNVANDQTTINISNLQSGIYMLRVQTPDNKLVTSRIIKQ